jgi:enoyl-CoA hydratase
VINSFVEGQVQNAQKLATVFDGITRNSPEGVAFQSLAKDRGLKTAIVERDGPGRTEEYIKMWKSVL